MRALLSQQPGFVLDQTFVQNFTIQPRSSNPVDFTPVNGTVNLNSIVFIMSAGGIGPSISVSDFKGLWFNAHSNLYPKQTWGANFLYSPTGCLNCTMENYFNNCSYGKVKMSSDNSVIADLTGVSMPLAGLTAVSKKPYDLSMCGFTTLFAYAEWAQTQYQVDLGLLTNLNFHL
jgi:hypothetical protein